MDEECESDIPDDPDEYSDTLVILLRKACHRGLSKVIMRQLFFRAVSNCQRLAPHFGESTVAAMKAKLELVHEDLVSHQTDMVSASGVWKHYEDFYSYKDELKDLLTQQTLSTSHQSTLKEFVVWVVGFEMHREKGAENEEYWIWFSVLSTNHLP